MAFILGRRGFWTLDLEVSRDTLIPRPESETLIEAALGLGESILRRVIGVIILAMLGVYVRRRMSPGEQPGGSAGFYGVSAGFATTVANAAGPVMNLYLLTQRLPKDTFVATGAWFFFVVNLTKLPIYGWYGFFSRASVAFDVLMIPAVVIGAMAGRWLLGSIPQKLFDTAVFALTAVSVVFLFA